jgi:hypothetical protein
MLRRAASPAPPARVQCRYRAALCVLLALCVYAAQLGALVHAISHLRGPALTTAASQSCVLAQGDSATGEDFCLQCLAYAQVTSVAPAQSLVTPFTSCHAAAIHRYREPVRRFANIVFLARGPPAI